MLSANQRRCCELKRSQKEAVVEVLVVWLIEPRDPFAGTQGQSTLEKLK
jgi:hypothetical protein